MTPTFYHIRPSLPLFSSLPSMERLAANSYLFRAPLPPSQQPSFTLTHRHCTTTTQYTNNKAVGRNRFLTHVCGPMEQNRDSIISFSVEFGYNNKFSSLDSLSYLPQLRGHPFMTSTRRGRGSGSGGRMWTGRGGQAPCGRQHRKLKLESTDVILSSSHAKKLASFFYQNFVFGQKKVDAC